MANGQDPLQQYFDLNEASKLDKMSKVFDRNTKIIGQAMTETIKQVEDQRQKVDTHLSAIERHEAVLTRMTHKTLMLEIMLDMLMRRAGITPEEIGKYADEFIKKLEAEAEAAKTPAEQLGRSV